MNGNYQLFKPSGMGSASTSDFIKQAFEDVSAPANSNAGLSSTISTNPLGGFYANDDAPKYGAKTLWIKDLVLIEDRTKWQDGQPTYRVIFHEQFPGVDGYVFGAPFLERGIRAYAGTGETYSVMNSRYQTNVGFRNFNGGMGVTGKIRRIIWLTTPNPSGVSGTDSALVQVDGVSGATIAQNDSDNRWQVTQGRVYASTVHAAANETNNLHDYRLLANGISADVAFALRITGVVVYFENAGANIEAFPGTTYVDKEKKETTGATLALPSFGSSLGGRSLVYKDTTGIYQIYSVGHTPVMSVATGASGTNLLTVITGHGASFNQFQGIIAKSGTSHYVGVIQSISTDTFTVGPTLPIGISGDIYPYYLSSVSAVISASLYGGEPAFTFGATTFQGATTGATISFWADPYNRYYMGINQMYGQYVGSTASLTDVDTRIWALYAGVSFLVGGGGNIAVQGRCSAADIEWYSAYAQGGGATQILQYHVLVDGVTTIVQDTLIGVSTSPRYIKHTLLADGGPQWHQFNVVLGQSHGPFIGIARINFYEYDVAQGITFGHLAQFDTMQAVASPFTGSSLFVAPGVHQRYMADSLYFKGGMTRSVRSNLDDSSYPAVWTGIGANDRLEFQWYGKDIMIKGSNSGGSLFISVDGVQNSAGVSLYNSVIPVATEGFHKLVVERRSANFVIGAVDVWRSHGELTNLQNFTAVEPAKVPFITDWTPYACYLVDDPLGSGGIFSHPNIGLKAKYKIIDDEMFIEIITNFTGAIPDGSYVFSLPVDYSVDYKRFTAEPGAFFIPIIGAGTVVVSSNAFSVGVNVLGSQYLVINSFASSTPFLQYDSNGFTQPGNLVTAFAAGDYIILRAQLTIVKPGT